MGPEAQSEYIPQKQQQANATRVGFKFEFETYIELSASSTRRAAGIVLVE